MKKYFIIYSFLIFIPLSICGQEDDIPRFFDKDTMISTLRIDYNEINDMRKVVNDSNMNVSSFSIDSVLKSNSYDYSTETESLENTSSDISSQIDSSTIVNGSNSENLNTTPTNTTTNSTTSTNNENINSDSNINTNTSTHGQKENDATVTTNNATYTSSSTSTSSSSTTHQSTHTTSIDVATSSSQNIEFKIQIAANNKPLSDKTLSTLNPNGYPVSKINEGGWYKYFIYSSNSYSDTYKFLNNNNIKNAFIVAYYKNTHLNLLNAIKGKIVPYSDYLVYSDKSTSTFNILITKSESPLSDNVIHQKYSGTNPVKEILYENTYYYFVYAGNSKPAAEIFKNTHCSPETEIIEIKDFNHFSNNKPIRLIFKN